MTPKDVVQGRACAACTPGHGSEVALSHPAEQVLLGTYTKDSLFNTFVGTFVGIAGAGSPFQPIHMEYKVSIARIPTMRRLVEHGELAASATLHRTAQALIVYLSHRYH